MHLHVHESLGFISSLPQIKYNSLIAWVMTLVCKSQQQNYLTAHQGGTTRTLSLLHYILPGPTKYAKTPTLEKVD